MWPILFVKEALLYPLRSLLETMGCFHIASVSCCRMECLTGFHCNEPSSGGGGHGASAVPRDGGSMY